LPGARAGKARPGDAYHPLAGWRCEEQRHLAQALIDVEPPLPKCHCLAGASQAPLVFGAARDARGEVAAALKEVMQETPPAG
jgi:hypothetical protein